MNIRLKRLLAGLLTASIITAICPIALAEEVPAGSAEVSSGDVEQAPSTGEGFDLVPEGELPAPSEEIGEFEARAIDETWAYAYARADLPETPVYSDAGLTDLILALREGDTVLVTDVKNGVASVSFDSAEGVLTGFVDAGALSELSADEVGGLIERAAGSGEVALYEDDINWPLTEAELVITPKGKDFTAISNDKQYVVQGKTITARMVGDHSDCWSWARALYNIIWGTKFTTDWQGTDETGRNLIRNLTDEERLLTGENLKNFIGQSELGCTLRICSCPSTCSNFSKDGCSKHEKHSLIVVDKDEDGMVVMDNMTGNGSDKFATRYYTWDNFASHWAKYKMVKYIKWPYAPTYVKPTVNRVEPTEVRLSESSLTLVKGAKRAISAEVLPAEADQGVSWKSSDNSVAYVSDGSVIAVGPGTATLTARASGSVSATVSVLVSNIQPTAVKLDKTGTQTLGLGYTLQLSAAFSPAGSASELQWRSSDERIARVSATGLVTPVKAGTATIAVTTTNNKTAKVKVKVVTPTGVTINKTGTVAMMMGQTLTLKTVVKPAQAFQGVEWLSSDPTIAVVEDGVVTAIGPGTATIGVKTTLGGKTAKVKVKVTDPNAIVEPTAVTLNKTGTVTLTTGQSLTLSYTFKPANARSAITWGSSNEKVAVISGGVVTAVGAGTATVGIVTANKKKATVKIKVVAPPSPATSVKLSKSGTVSLKKGKTLKLTATMKPAKTSSTYTWKSTNEAVARISSSGVVTAVKAGTATVGVITDNGKYATVKIKVG